MTETKIYKIKGMHCASCSATIEKTFKKTEGVSHAEANYGTESVKIAFDPGKLNARALSDKIKPFGYRNAGCRHAPGHVRNGPVSFHGKIPVGECYTVPI